MKDIVAKFGGSSMADGDCMAKSALVAIQNEARIVIVSATYGTTDTLIRLAMKAQDEDWDSCRVIYERIKSRHEDMADELNLEPGLRQQLDQILEELKTLIRGIALLHECSPKARDSVLSIGERLSSILFTQAMNNKLPENNAQWFDIRDVMTTDNHYGKATPLTDKIRANARTYLMNRDRIYVTQGFIGRNEEGFTTTLGRGGSDYSASLIGEAVDADIIQIWTDIAGIATTDPRVCSGARPIENISFREAEELAIFGAKILHPTMLYPAKRASIPVFVGSTFEPDKNGTWIREYDQEKPLIRAMAIKEDQTLLTLYTPTMFNTYGFMSKVFDIFNRYRISVDAITTSEISVALTLDDPESINNQFIEELKQFAEVRLESNYTLVSIIGNNINYQSGIAKQVFELLGDINVRMICQGASMHNFCFLVNENDGRVTLQRLHNHFLEIPKEQHTLI